MGLESVELVMDVEDHFGITIRDSEAEKIRTVGDLVSLVQQRICAARAAVCPSLSTFLALRTVVRKITNNSALRIRPHHFVEDVLAGKQRRLLWNKLKNELEAEPQSLRRPLELRALLASLIFSLLFFGFLASLAVDIRILPLTLTLAAIVIFVYCRATLPCCTELPAGYQTFGDLTRKMVGEKVASKQLELKTAEHVLGELRIVIVDVLGVDPKKVVPSARFVEDFGLD